MEEGQSVTTLRLPIRLALAQTAREVPSGPRWSFEPKLDLC
jgi:hypothetical protein